jgi:hypothetical protein
MKHWDDDALAVCDNCLLRCAVSALDSIVDLGQRLDAGGEVPAGQCPACGALAYLRSEDPVGGDA